MSCRNILRYGAAILAIAAASPSLAGADPLDKIDSLAEAFRDPPQSARPRVWWHWMNGNISKDGIAKDLAWMKRIGIGGVQNFDADLSTPQIVDKRLVYMSPEWKSAFRFAVSEADRLGLELAVASSPGFSETGGPWVKPEDGLKKIVWSTTAIDGGKRFVSVLPAPPVVIGPFQTAINRDSVGKIAVENPYYRDIAVLAVPVAETAMAKATVRNALGVEIDPATLLDDDLETGLSLPAGIDGAPVTAAFEFAALQSVQSASLFIPGAKTIYGSADIAPQLEASDDGRTWRKIAEFTLSPVPTTISFAPVTAKHFRVVLVPLPPEAPRWTPAPGTMAGGPAKAPLVNRPRARRIHDLRLSNLPKIDHFEFKSGFGIATDYYALGNRVADAVGANPQNVIDLTAKLQADGRLDWLPSAGKWQVLRLGTSLLGTTNHPAPKEATGLEVDKFDGAAVRRYLDHYLALYREAATPDLFGKRGLRAILTDSIEVGAANWTPRMLEQFERLRGYDARPWLPALAGIVIGSRAQSDRFLYDYRRTLADLMVTEHYGTIASIAGASGLKVYGEALEDHRPSLGDDMAMRRYADVPMAAMWSYGPEEGPRTTYLADLKGASSVAHVYGQNIAAAESLTSAMQPYAYSPAHLRPVIDLEFAYGINLPIIHTSVHQPLDAKFPGLSFFFFGQYFNRHESWAEMAKPWVDYMARNAFMLQQGRNVADVAYFYGEEAPLTGLYGKMPVADAPTAHAFDFINADALMNIVTNDGSDLVAPGGARYRVLYLGGSSHRMTLKMVQRIAELAEKGATIIGLAPTGSPSLADAADEYRGLVQSLWAGGAVTQVGKGRVIASQDIDTALRQIAVAPDVHFKGGQSDSKLPFVHRQLPDGHSYFVVNRANRPEAVEAHFRVTGKVPELWHADTGASEPVSYRIADGQTVVPLSLAKDQSVHIVFRKDATSQAVNLPVRSFTSVQLLDGAWTVSFQPDRGAPASVLLPQLLPLNEHADSAIKHFSGIATYAKEFTPPRQWKKGQSLWLDLGEVRELAEVIVNGKAAGGAWHAPFRVDVGPFLHRGRNTLSIKVANLWVNRLIGDAQPGAQKITFTSMLTYRADAKLLPSGLIGPVTLQTKTIQ
ncbi:glycoside hydrolase [Novosphingobium sp. AAP83]|uniref:glycosyl hydrolase n=1 Tax=Novosphingobium sp. AAP83 TaxID=1523425 RepID=UPI0006B91B17|nr:glycosyl hydrolase [Novosphingobium sp. AAP83]KPF91882.1 glycoside hydrolase [Novosphingobium sp. AAP83]